ncbi:MAG: hypothetical protein ABL908_15930, partial [Hyphomicrobium sp.]
EQVRHHDAGALPRPLRREHHDRAFHVREAQQPLAEGADDQAPPAEQAYAEGRYTVVDKPGDFAADIVARGRQRMAAKSKRA